MKKEDILKKYEECIYRIKEKKKCKSPVEINEFQAS